MNSTSSDDLVSILAAPTTRRQALKALTVTTVAAPLALNGIGTALASPKLPQASQQVQAASGKAEDIVAIAQEAMKQNDLQAVILSVSIGNKNIVTTALGESMTGVPATTQMHFRIGSVSFAYLSTVLLQLVDQKRLRLEDRLSTWLPSLPHAESITVQKITGKSAVTLIQERILAPLGLHETASSLTAEIRPPVLHAFDSERGIYEESSFWNPSWTTASDAVMTSDIENVRKSAIAIGEGTLVSSASHQEQIAPVSLISPPGQPKVY
jgi:CubicO group peptidase (beta-lactamase class C family)